MLANRSELRDKQFYSSAQQWNIGHFTVPKCTTHALAGQRVGVIKSVKYSSRLIYSVHLKITGASIAQSA